MTELLRKLVSHDWDFANAPANKGIHAIHPYPAKFIPQIPRQLINLYCHDEGGIVLDPFCGSGTTLVEAITAGHDAWGIDLNPLACLITRVKTVPIDFGFDLAKQDVLTVARENVGAGCVTVPSIPNLDHWFKPEVQQVLAALIAEIRSVSSQSIQDALKVALSSIIVRVSNQESDTRYAAIEKNISQQVVFDLFERATASLFKSVTSFRNDMFQKFGHATILNRDIMSVSPEDLPRNVGLVITSPPYPNAYEYWLYHKYRMFWLGMDPIEVKEREIGARPHFFKKNPQDERDFESQMTTCFALLSKVMIRRAKACFLVGRSIIHGRRIDNLAILKRAAEIHGFFLEASVERQIPNTRRTFNPSHGNINKEHVAIFSLEG